MHRTSGPVTAALTALTALLGAAMIAVSCDTGDGRELTPPVFPPPTTTILPTIDTGLPVDGVPVTTGVGAATTLPSLQPFALLTPWVDGAQIPEINTCDGDDTSPGLSWTGVPLGTIELALVVTDDDADGFVHWILTGFDPQIASLLAGEVPVGARQWPNSFGEQAWGGPCPPPGSTHTYRFVLHALNQQLEAADDTSVQELLALVDELTLGTAVVTGTFTR